jgi:predicted RND superfamily exporter protein
MTDNNIYNEIENLIKDNISYRFKLEKNDPNIQDPKRLEILEKIINNLEVKNEIKKDKDIKEETEDIKNKDIKPKNKIENMFDNIEKEIYKQTWNRIKPYYREKKIIEYIEDTYKKYTEKDMENIKNFIKEKINEGFFKTQKSVNYDNKLGKIIAINDLDISKKDNSDVSISIITSNKSKSILKKK